MTYRKALCTTIILGLMTSFEASGQPLDIRKPGSNEPVTDQSIINKIDMSWSIGASKLADAHNDILVIIGAGWGNSDDEFRATLLDDAEKSFGKIQLTGNRAAATKVTFDETKVNGIAEVFQAGEQYLVGRQPGNNVVWLETETPGYSKSIGSCGFGVFAEHLVFYKEGGMRKSAFIYCWANRSSKIEVDNPQGAAALWHDTAHEAIHAGSMTRIFETDGMFPRFGAIGDTLPTFPTFGIYGPSVEGASKNNEPTWLVAAAYERFAIRRAYWRFAQAERAAGRTPGELLLDNVCNAQLHDAEGPPPPDPSSHDWAPKPDSGPQWPTKPTAADTKACANGGGTTTNTPPGGLCVGNACGGCSMHPVGARDTGSTALYAIALLAAAFVVYGKRRHA